MKLTSFSTIILLQLSTSFILFIPQIQSTLSHTSLLEQICRQSPHYHLCIMTLRSSINHRSKEDIAGFARLTLEIVKANASIALERIHERFVQSRDPKVFEDCLASYNMIVKVHLREALNAMNRGDHKVVKQKAYGAGIEAEACNNKIKNLKTLSLRDTNRYVQNLCAITRTIVNNLLQPNQRTST